MSQSSKPNARSRPSRPAPAGKIASLRSSGAVGGDFAILASRFNGDIVDQLAAGAVAALGGQGIATERILLVPVPGAWELPTIASRLAESGAFAAIIALGCVLRGETAHFDVLVNESARGLMQISIAHGLPIANGVLACDTLAQAEARAGGEFGNKGEEAALAALATAACVEQLIERFGGRDRQQHDAKRQGIRKTASRPR